MVNVGIQTYNLEDIYSEAIDQLEALAHNSGRSLEALASTLTREEILHALEDALEVVSAGAYDQRLKGRQASQLLTALLAGQGQTTAQRRSVNGAVISLFSQGLKERIQENKARKDAKVKSDHERLNDALDNVGGPVFLSRLRTEFSDEINFSTDFEHVFALIEAKQDWFNPREVISNIRDAMQRLADQGSQAGLFRDLSTGENFTHLETIYLLLKLWASIIRCHREYRVITAADLEIIATQVKSDLPKLSKEIGAGLYSKQTFEALDKKVIQITQTAIAEGLADQMELSGPNHENDFADVPQREADLHCPALPLKRLRELLENRRSPPNKRHPEDS